MATSPLREVVRNFRKANLARDAATLSDREILEWFLDEREEAAFEALVRRHGPLVLGVCRRILHHAHDAEDAFQATFLVLMRKAASITKRDTLGAWLYGVAYRIAIRAKVMNARRRSKENQVRERPQPDAFDETSFHDLETLLDQEVNRLPARYRVPLVLCELEGLSRRVAARQLRVPEGTLSSRLARARDMLRGRLTARGVTLSAAALATVLSQTVATAAVPARLVQTTTQAVTLYGAVPAAAGLVSANALTLADGMLKVFLLHKLKLGLALVLGLGLAWAGLRAGGSTGSHTLGSVGEFEAVALVSTQELAPIKVEGEADEPTPGDPEDGAPFPDAPEAAPEEIGRVVKTPPARLHCDPFYKKFLNANGLPILASDKVSDEALHEAAYLVENVLYSRPDVRKVLADEDVRFVVMHRTEKTTDFPEQRDLKPKQTWDRIRGLGDRLRNCGEENLLRQPGDTSRGRCVLIHQIGYAIYHDGGEALEPDFKTRLKQLHQTAERKGLWKGTRAAANQAEYWSELVTCYFDANRVRLRWNGSATVLKTREDLAAYDPDGFALVEEVFRKPDWRYQPPERP